MNGCAKKLLLSRRLQRQQPSLPTALAEERIRTIDAFTVAVSRLCAAPLSWVGGRKSLSVVKWNDPVYLLKCVAPAVSPFRKISKHTSQASLKFSEVFGLVDLHKLQRKYGPKYEMSYTFESILIQPIGL